jgi:hypothetical protein
VNDDDDGDEGDDEIIGTTFTVIVRHLLVNYQVIND